MPIFYPTLKKSPYDTSYIIDGLRDPIIFLFKTHILLRAAIRPRPLVFAFASPPPPSPTSHSHQPVAEAVPSSHRRSDPPPPSTSSMTDGSPPSPQI
jgi:hypothetical protein